MSEPNILMFLVPLLLCVALNEKFAKKYFRIYWLVSGIALAFAFFNVPATSFIWPVYVIKFTGSLYVHIRADFLLIFGIGFAGIICWEFFRILNLVRKSTRNKLNEAKFWHLIYMHQEYK